MKKAISLILALALIVMAFAGCAAQPKEEDVTIRIGGLKGPTSMGLVKVMEDNENGAAANDYAFTIAGSADEVTPKLIQGELDIAAVPANLASVLYNNTDGAVQLLAVNTLGVIYIVEKGETIQSVADLAGKTIYATGKGSTPEYALRYILAENGIDPDKDVTIEWKSEPTEVVSTLASTDGGVAMLPQPFVTVAQGTVEGLRIAVDLTQAWDALENGSMLITGVLLVRRDFAEQHPQAIANFLKEYEASTKYVNENNADAAQLIEKFDIVKAAVAEKALPYCNITYIAGADMKAPMDGYLKVLFDQNPASVGGTLPDSDFYYEG
ncbi:MAG: ABC transporter substrate-binding protein [Clostridiaceae bacterium]|nr:ABC transporter substrate-binding protein [Clostridiaceae bacterium]